MQFLCDFVVYFKHSGDSMPDRVTLPSPCRNIKYNIRLTIRTYYYCTIHTNNTAPERIFSDQMPSEMNSRGRGGRTVGRLGSDDIIIIIIIYCRPTTTSKTPTRGKPARTSTGAKYVP